MICPRCKTNLEVKDETTCQCGYFYKVKSRELYKIESDLRRKEHD